MTDSPNGADYRALRISGLPGASTAPLAGGEKFVTYCLAGEPRARNRRDAIKRARAKHKERLRRAADPYRTALLYTQRLGVALEDLGRLAIALGAVGTSDAFTALRRANYGELDAVFERLCDESALRAAFKLPVQADVAELDEELREPILAASSAQAARWTARWSPCAQGWPLLRRIAKGMRHGSPLIPRETVISAPGSGALGAKAGDPFERWVLVINTDQDDELRSIATQWVVADISDSTLDLAHRAVLDGIALASDLADAHVGRVTQGYKWVFSRAVLKTLPGAQRAILERHGK